MNNILSQRKKQLLFEQKIYRFRRKKKKNLLKKKPFRDYFYCKKRLKLFSPLAIKEFVDKGIASEKYKTNHIYIPCEFSFRENFDGCMDVFKRIISGYIYGHGNIIIDFSRCKYTSISTFTLLDLLLEELRSLRVKYNKGLYHSILKRIDVFPSSFDVKTNKYIHSFGYLNIKFNEEEDSYFLPLRLHRGKQRRKYQENRKTTVLKYIVDYINVALEGIGKSLTITGSNNIELLLSEILNNAEDHSIKNSEWFVNGISFLEKQHGQKVVELNLSIINFGLSMYEGFEETKLDNLENYSIVQEKYEKHKKLFTETTKFEKESLYVLYMLNEGISRLKFESESRGNGTMQFLEAFILLGSFGNSNPNFKSQLNVISGHTVLTCDNEFSPYVEGNFSKLSLNKEKKLSLLPDSEYLKYNKEYFPGTILECKIYLNEDYFNEVLNNGKE